MPDRRTSAPVFIGACMPPALTSPADAPKLGGRALLALAVGSAGVVYGDIGTSPLYAFRESIAHLRGPAGVLAAADVLGVVSLMLWALTVIVTIKYVLVLSRFDNRGEGGVLSLMALVQRAGVRKGRAVLLIGMLGAGLFFGDAMLTPAISVLSAVEGLEVIEPLQGRLDAFIVPISLVILAGLFLMQRHGTGHIGRWFGPICLVWFIVLAVLGVAAIVRAPQVLAALSPLPGLDLIVRRPAAGALAVLGSVFLTVTGAEALYADMGHFGRRPIQLAWLALVFPCLGLNYLGQGALVLTDPQAAQSPFFLLAPEALRLPLVLLATAATVIASQAVISGAYSLSQQAVQLGLLPRLTFRPTSEDHLGQIYAPQVNWLLMAGVTILTLAFGSSAALAHAYGLSVVGAMITSSILAVVAVRRLRGRPLWFAILALSPFLLLEGTFLLANLMKVTHGGYVPLIIAAAVIFVMLTWVRGKAQLQAAEARDLNLSDLTAMLANRPPMRARGTAVFLTAEPDKAPASLMHNLKHNQVLHEAVVLLTVTAARRPRVPDAERVQVRDLGHGFKAVTLTYGYMETPDVARGLMLARSLGVTFDIMRTSFFVSRRTLIPRQRHGLARVQDLLFLYLSRNAVRAADFFQLPPSRVVELGAQVTL
jgi:KUP system potassium uptake protein